MVYGNSGGWQAKLPDVEKPVIPTGAMRPYEFRDTDPVQSVTEALLACGLLATGVWVVTHTRALRSRCERPRTAGPRRAKGWSAGYVGLYPLTREGPRRGRGRARMAPRA